jgi:ATP-dependent DNA ligase
MYNKKEHHRCVLIDNFALAEFPFEDRLANLELFSQNNPQFIMPEYIRVTTIEEILHYEEHLLKNNQEGIVIRNPRLTYKEGVSSEEGEFLRIKRFISEEAIILSVAPAYKTNPLPEPTELYDADGDEIHYERKVASAEIGKFFCKLVKNIYDPWSKRLIAKKNSQCVVAAGNLPRAEKIRLYQERDKLPGMMIKFKLFPKGSKDKPRFPTFESFVAKADSPI